VLGISLSKIIFTILIIVVVWKGFGLVNRLANERQEALRRQGNPPRGARGRRGEAKQSAIELRECPRCGAYVDPREDCSCGLRTGEARRV
jgi:ribosomal protein L32